MPGQDVASPTDGNPSYKSDRAVVEQSLGTRAREIPEERDAMKVVERQNPDGSYEKLVFEPNTGYWI